MKHPVLRMLPALLGLASLQNAHALQGGSVMPEYVNFTPAENPDLVNLNSGDFNYSIPMGEVPGPYGAFPISMGYSAGIGPNQEATWVGLGWTLNPGAINRTLRGTPDDQFHGGELSYIYQYSTTTTWGVSVGWSQGVYSLNMGFSSSGGISTSATLGPSIGIASVGVSFGTDGVGLSAKVGAAGVGATGSISFGAGGYKGSSIGVGVMMGGSAGAATADASIGLQHQSGKGVAFTSGFGITTKNGTGMSLSSSGEVSANYGSYTASLSDKNMSLGAKGGSASFSVGASGIGISGAGGASDKASTANFAIVIPIPQLAAVISFGYQRTVFESWVRQATNEYLYGYMYQAGPAIMAGKESNDNAIPNAAMNTNSAGTIPWHWNYKGKSLDRAGGAMEGDMEPGWDMYGVSSDGVSGSFRPYSLTRHAMLASLERLPGVSNKDDAQVLNYLVDEDPVTRTQFVNEFDTTAIKTLSPAAFTKYAYNYCYDAAKTSHKGYYDTRTDNAALLADVTAAKCSKFAVLKSRHLNESSRLIVRRFDDDTSKFRSRMVFRFMADGFYSAEEPEWSAAAKLGRYDLSPHLFQKSVNSVNYPVWGSRRIEPVLENDVNTGRLRGFKITAENGTQYFFTKPVRTLLQADYTTNQPKGVPLFVDKHSARAGDNFIDLIGNAFVDFATFNTSLILNPVKTLGRLSGYADEIFNFAIGKGYVWDEGYYVDKCDDNNQTKRYNFSYSMKTNPYATQWLLEEIRGPEFVELSNSDMSKNIGYQVKLSYQDPQWYKWRFPYAPPNTPNNELPNFRIPKNGRTDDNCLPDMYQSSFGVKELVYLKSIETATHMAEFKMNDSINDARLDGKGWIQDWIGMSKKKTTGEPDNPTALPIFVNSQLEAKVEPVAGLTWKKYCTSPTNVTYKACWWEQPVRFSFQGIYLNMNPTQEQINRYLATPHKVLVTGMNSFSEPLDPVKKTQLAFAGMPRKELAMGSGTSLTFPIAKAFHPSSGKKAHLGSTFMEFQAPIYLQGTQPASYENFIENGNTVFRYNFKANSCNTANCSVAFPDVGTTVTGVTLPESMVFGIGSTLTQPVSAQPLIVMNDFYETIDTTDNQMRYLKEVRIGEKSGSSLIVARKYVLTHDWNIQPGTLNSYPAPAVAKIPDLVTQYPGWPDYTDPTKSPTMDPSLNGLGGKLNLKKVQEFACGNADCTQNVSLPPFQFAYKEEQVSPFYKGETFFGSIVNSSDPQDEWGFWNKFASHDNHKVSQAFASYGAAAWSLDRVIDPSGGVLEVQYERDTYMGEDYSEDEKAIPVSWRRCSATDGGQDPNMLCIDVLPRTWVNYCDKDNKLRGEWTFNPGTPVPSDYNYVAGIDTASQLYFQLDGKYTFKVGCGMNFFGWKSHGCKRSRLMGVVGSARIAPKTNPNRIVKIQNKIKIAMENPVNQAENWIANEVMSIQTDLPYIVVADKLKEVGQEHTNHTQRSAPHPYRGTLWIKQQRREIKGGDIRVSKLVKVDIGARQTTTYKYAPGELAQYPDSLLSTAFAQRFSPSKAIGIIPNTILPSLSRIPGVRDEEINYLPGSKVSYPKVTVYNTMVDPSDKTKTIVLNGKTEYRFVGPETGYDLSADGGKLGGMFRSEMRFSIINELGFKDLATGFEQPNIKVTLLDSLGAVLYSQNLGSIRKLADKNYDVCKNAAGNVIGCNEPGVVLGTEKGKITSFSAMFYAPGGVANISKTYSVKLEYTPPGQTVAISRTLKLDDYSPGSRPLKKFVDVALTWGVNQYPGGLDAAGLGDLKQSDNVPVVYKLTTPAEDNTEKVIADYSTLIGKPVTTTYYRWIPASATDRNILGETASETKYKLLKQDSLVYTSKAPSLDDRFVTNANTGTFPESLGVDVDKWMYQRKYNCKDLRITKPEFVACNWTSGTANGFSQHKYGDFTWNSASPTGFGYRKVRYARYSTFTKAVYQKKGFNNSTGPQDYLVTKLMNHRFDPVTGSPTFTVSYSGPNLGMPGTAEPAAKPGKGTRMSPAYLAGTSLSNTMFERNMLTQTFREDAYTWQTAATSNGQATGTPLNFNGADLNDQLKMNPALTSVKITPFSQSLLNFSGGTNGSGFRTLLTRDNPILGLGSFTSRFNLNDVFGQGKLAANGALLQPDLSTAAKTKAFLKDWAGVKINSVTNTFKATDEEDVEGVHASHRFDPSGFHQIAVFNNAPLMQTAAWTLEGRYTFPDLVAYNEWRYSGGGGTRDGNTLRLTGNWTMSHSLQWVQNKNYLVEFQLHSLAARNCDVGTFYEGGSVGESKTVAIKAGLSTYQVSLKANMGLTAPAHNNRFRLSCQDNATAPAMKLSYLRVYPEDAEAGLYVYDSRSNMVQMVNENNLSTYYTYDWFGNLTGIRNDDGLMFSGHKREWTNVGQ